MPISFSVTECCSVLSLSAPETLREVWEPLAGSPELGPFLANLHNLIGVAAEIAPM